MSTSAEERALLSIALMAAFADGAKGDAERAEVKRIAASFGDREGLDMPAVLQDVLMQRVSLDQAVQPLSPAARTLAYELAVGVCDADGAQNDAERAFLERLRTALGIDAAHARRVSETAEAVAAAPLATAVTAVEPTPVPAGMASKVPAAELDKMILNYAILNGALELLPDSLASMAIIPLQMKMVYRVGAAHGFELDRGHVKDFVATAGVGLASQYVEQIGAKLIGGLLKKVGGGLLGGLGKQATSSAVSFATTYALGQLAKRYYAGGRTMSADLLKQTFSDLLADAKGLQGKYAGEIQQKARTVDVQQVLQAVRGGR